MPSTIIDEVRELFQRSGGSQYGGEAVSQLEHALQAAALAEMDGAPASLVTASLLHDVGHLLHDLPDNAPDRGIDDRHEALAADWLGKRFGPGVIEPARLHVEAKRYLCAIDSEYQGRLSPPSLLSLKLQGGAMSADEARRFESLPYQADAVRLRRYDDEAKDPEMTTPDLEHFLEAVARAAEESAR